MVSFFGDVLASTLVGAGGDVTASFLVRAGGIVPVSFLVGTGWIVLAPFSVGVQVPSSDPSSARSVKTPPTSLHSVLFLFPSLVVLVVGASYSYQGMVVE